MTGLCGGGCALKCIARVTEARHGDDDSEHGSDATSDVRDSSTLHRVQHLHRTIVCLLDVIVLSILHPHTFQLIRIAHLCSARARNGKSIRCSPKVPLSRSEGLCAAYNLQPARPRTSCWSRSLSYASTTCSLHVRSPAPLPTPFARPSSTSRSTRKHTRVRVLTCLRS